ncbi:hypothetical protein [Aquimarina agarivorans]|uniref:hypothetical protein n=1 Tax=Aquimarina agarivorans TaxID=980584 RepID=UPI000248ED6E|nr:hypothetical protein [Aquimarina agarivorans]
MNVLVTFTLFIFSFCASVSSLLAQQNNTVDFKTIEAQLQLDTLQQKIKGNLTVTFKALQNSTKVYLDAQKNGNC